MKSPRMDLVEAVAECLRIIATPDFNTDAGQWVTTEPKQVDDEAPGVLAVVFERQSRPTDPAIRRTHRNTTIAVILKLPHDQDEAQATLDLAIADVELAMENRQNKFPVGTSFPEYIEMLPIPAEKGMGWIGALLRYESNVPAVRRTP